MSLNDCRRPCASSLTRMCRTRGRADTCATASPSSLRDEVGEHRYPASAAHNAVMIKRCVGTTMARSSRNTFSPTVSAPHWPVPLNELYAPMKHGAPAQPPRSGGRPKLHSEASTAALTRSCKTTFLLVSKVLHRTLMCLHQPVQSSSVPSCPKRTHE